MRIRNYLQGISTDDFYKLHKAGMLGSEGKDMLIDRLFRERKITDK